jgi:hypothetical protein
MTSLSPRDDTFPDAFLRASDSATVLIHAESEVRLSFREGQVWMRASIGPERALLSVQSL